MKWELVACDAINKKYAPAGIEECWAPMFDKGCGWMPQLDVWFSDEASCQVFIDELLFDLRNPDD